MSSQAFRELDEAAEVELAAVKLLAVREQSRQQLRRKLKARHADLDLVDVVLDDLEQRGLLSDQRFAEAYVEQRSRVFHEEIPVPGTDMTLHYASNRVTGYQDVITIPASGPTVPASLKNIVVNVRVAGRNFSQILDPLPDQKTEVIWDGLDYLGNPVFGPVSARVDIGFVYDVVYLTPRDLRRAFAQAGGSVTGVQGRSEVTSWKRTQVMLHRAQGTIADGWTMSPHHSRHGRWF